MHHKLFDIAVFSCLVLLLACCFGTDDNIRQKSVNHELKIVLTGADQTDLYLPLLQDKYVGLVANHTTLINTRHLADTLLCLGIKLRRIFAPEHGFRGTGEAGATMTNDVDKITGLPVISLYGSKKKPLPADMEGIDIMVYDIQDVGVRFYTYISTLHYIMEACAEMNIPLLVLDRPNPLGYYIDGPVLDTNFRSFIGLHPIPVVYGMTTGELATLINGEKWLKGGIKCNLSVIPCKNYDHTVFYSLPVPPSPNLNTMESVYLYPSLCLFEGTKMSVGRGTDLPFTRIGHPDYPDTGFSFIPKANTSNRDPLFRDKKCYGLNFFAPLNNLRNIRKIQIQWIIDCYFKMQKDSTFFTGYFDKLAGNDRIRREILAGKNEEALRESWSADLQKFLNLRKNYLLYKDFY